MTDRWTVNPIPDEEFERVAALKGGIAHIIKDFCEGTHATWLVKQESVYLLNVLIRYLDKEDRLELEKSLRCYSSQYCLFTENHGRDETREMELTIRMKTPRETRNNTEAIETMTEDDRR